MSAHLTLPHFFWKKMEIYEYPYSAAGGFESITLLPCTHIFFRMPEFAENPNIRAGCS
jgi:hypothetical protein